MIARLGYIALLSLVGCATAGKLVSSSSGPASPGAISSETPSALVGLEDDMNRADQTIGQLEGQPSVGARDVALARVGVMHVFGAFYRGGTNAGECTDCYAHPKYAQLKTRFPALEQRMEKLESKVGECTFGYQTSDGAVHTLDLGWSKAEWDKLESESKHQQPRCWLDKDKTAYL